MTITTIITTTILPLPPRPGASSCTSTTSGSQLASRASQPHRWCRWLASPRQPSAGGLGLGNATLGNCVVRIGCSTWSSFRPSSNPSPTRSRWQSRPLVPPRSVVGKPAAGPAAARDSSADGYEPAEGAFRHWGIYTGIDFHDRQVTRKGISQSARTGRAAYGMAAGLGCCSCGRPLMRRCCFSKRSAPK